MSVQELNTGNTVDQRFARLGVAKSATRAGPKSVFGMVSGAPSCGKTNLFMSCPDAYIVNVDQASMPASKADDIHAGVWPGVNEQGQSIDTDGKPFLMKWEKVQEKVDLLKELAENNQPRPGLVVFDTLAGLLSLGQEYLTRKSGKTDFKQLDGRRAYDDLYALIINACADLRRCGYGVWLCCHIVNRTIQVGEDRYEDRPKLTITGGFWQRLFWQLEISMVLTAEWDMVSKEVEQDTGRKGADGKPIVRKRTVTEKARKHILTVNREEYAGITKGKVEFPDVVVPRVGSWAAFEDAYTKS